MLRVSHTRSPYILGDSKQPTHPEQSPSTLSDPQC